VALGVAPASASADQSVPCTGGTFAGASGLANAIVNGESGTASPTIDLTAGCTYTFTAPDALAAHVLVAGQSTSVDLDGWYGPDALPAIATAITIDGDGATIARSSAVGTPSFRLFFVGADPSAPATPGWTTPGAGSLTLNDVTLTGGLAQGGSADGGGGGLGAGGAIYNQGTVALNRVTLSGDEALGGTGGVVALDSDGGAGMGSDSGSNGFGAGFGAGFAAPAGASTGGPFLPGGGAGGGASGGGFRSGENGTSQDLIGGAAGGGMDTGTGGAGGFRDGADGAGGPAGDGSGGGGSGYNPTADDAGNSSGGGFGNGGSIGMTGGGDDPGGGGGGVGGGGGASICAGGGGGGFGGGGGYSDDVSCPSLDTGRFGTGGFGAGRGGAGAGDGSGGNGGFGGGGGGIGAVGGGGGAGLGGAIFNHNGTLTASNVTLAGDSAVGGPVSPSGGVAGQGMGGAIFDLDGTLSLTNSTLTDNSADQGGALYVLGYDHSGATDPAAATLVNDILAGTPNPAASLPPADLMIDAPADVATALANADSSNVTSTAPNIAQLAQASGTGALTGSVSQVAPLLAGSLAYLGGPGMLTLAPGAGSPAIGAGTTVGAPSTDERGVARPAGGPIDLGAVQLSGLAQSQNPAPVSPAPPVGPIAPATPTPELSAVTQSASKWTESNLLAQITPTLVERARVPVGTTFRFGLSEPAVVTFAFTQRVAGRKLGGHCLARTKRNARHPACTRTVTIGTLALPASAGANSVRFGGRLSERQKLAPGSYAVVITATDGGRTSTAQTLRFTIAESPKSAPRKHKRKHRHRPAASG
jgi:hypothetical protein